MSLSFPGAYNVYVPSHKATAGLMTGFSRNPRDFPVNKYLQVMEVDKQLGYYATWNSRQGARVRSSNLSEFMWADGQPAPTGADNLDSFGYVQYRTLRYAFPFLLGDIAVKSADWDVLKAHADSTAMQAMTARSYLAYGVWSTAASWGTHCANVDGAGSTLNGNNALNASSTNWTTGTDTNPVILKNLNTCRIAINKDTVGTISNKDVYIVTNPTTASQMATSQEIHTYLARSQYALAQVKGDTPGQNAQYGMPDQLYGSQFIVDDTVLVSSEKPSTSTAYLIADGDVLIAVRKGGLEGIGGGPAHSTIMYFFHKDDMTVESYHDVNDRLTRGRVISDFTVVLTTNSSGFYLKRAVG